MADYNATNEELDSFDDLRDIMGQTNMDNVTVDSGDTNNFGPLPDGYYLCEVEKAVLKRSKSSGKPMVAFTFKVVANGIITKVDESTGDSYPARAPRTVGRKIFKNFVIDDKDKLEKFASNMLKFEGEEPGVPILEKDYFTTPEVLRDALGVLEGMRIYVLSRTTIKDNNPNTFYTLIKWESATEMALDDVPEAE